MKFLAKFLITYIIYTILQEMHLVEKERFCEEERFEVFSSPRGES